MRTLLLTLGFYIPFQMTMAQGDDDLDNHIESKLESGVLRIDNPDADFQSLNRFSEEITEKIDINRASREDLESIPFINEEQISAIEDYLKLHGKLTDLEELQFISALDSRSLEQLLPFIKFEPGQGFDSKNEIDRKSKDMLSMRFQRVLEKSNGYEKSASSPNASFKGSPWQVFLRFNHTYQRKLKFGVTMEKDAGEILGFDDAANAFDHKSLYIQINHIRWLDNLIIGDYHMSFGQGLTCSTGPALGKSSEVLLTEHKQSGFRPNASSDEFFFLRGTAFSIKWKKWMVSPFISSRRTDVNVVERGSRKYISSFYQSGLHRTGSEIAKRGLARRDVFGGDFEFRCENFKIGFVLVNGQLDMSHDPNFELYEFHRPKDQIITKLGIYHSLRYKNISFFSEVSRTLRSGMAMLGGISVRPDKKLAMSILYRRYDVNFETSFSSAFGENSKNENECGFYSSVKFDICPGLSTSLFVDLFSFPWLKYNIPSPSGGCDNFGELKYRASRNLEILLQCKYKIKGAGFDSKLGKVMDKTGKKLRFQILQHIGKEFRLRSRVEMTNTVFDGRKSSGIMLFQEFKYKIPSSPVSFVIRYCLFDTENYETRIYAYEQDLPGLYSIPSFYDNGNRYFALIQYRLSRIFDIQLKLAQTVYQNLETIGSGHDAIESQHKTSVAIMCRAKW